MDLSSIGALIENLRTDRVMEFIRDAQLGDLMKARWFWGSTIALALFFLIMKWRGMLVTLVALVGFTWLLAYTTGQGTNLESGAGSSTLLFFVCGAAVLLGLVIYLLFIRSD